MEYKGKKVIKHRVARFFPSDDQYEDFICNLILTEDMLYVVEPVYDGTTTIHFHIPVRSIGCIEKYTETDPSDISGSSPKRGGFLTELVSGVIMVLAGVLVISGMQQKKPKEYLRIAYRDDFEEDQYLYFHELDKNMKGLIKGVQELQKRRSNHD